MIIPEIISQHSEEALFLWFLRDRAANAPHYSLANLAKLDNRLEAHLDGLRIAGDAGWEIVEQGLERTDTGAIFTAGALAFETLDENRMQRVVEVGITSLDLSRGLISALGWLPVEKAAPLIDRMLVAELSAVRRVGVAASAVHRRDPADLLRNALLDDDLALRARALKAVGELGRVDLLPYIRENLNSPDDLRRFSAAWSGAILRDGNCVDALRSLTVPDNLYGEEAVRIVSRRMELSSAHLWQKELAESPTTARLAVACAGVIGDPALIPWLIERMEVSELARAAGEAFTMITGVDIAYEDLEGKWPEGFEAGPTENPEDDYVELDPDEDLPWPNPDLIQKWWNRHKGQFSSGIRYLMGRPISPEHLEHVLRSGRQRQREAAALELAMLRPGQPLFEVRAPGFRQQQVLDVRR